ncbi:multicopper oxidase domain-containing protein [Nitrosomonas aestuarii]|uniref:multicopper oxidase domain-containing protein n=1 Tax=Nitrosomonas aestuarii TaxID=52441 RepID=UPI000D2F69B1|nr:multicopper oxidase domain-containing protein [Nitrosomonas aestuarii]PTN11040.1 DNA-binding beta-propeller fold protein YncE [Nitrosomonas aestuarii]
MKSIIFWLNKKTMTALMAFMTAMLFSSIALAATTHTINITAETLPNGQLGYKMISHDGSTQNYPAEAIIPGPTLFAQLGDTINITLTNNTGVPVGLNIPGILENAAEAAAGGGSQNYSFTANQAGTYPYYDDGSGLLGLFGALIVNAVDGSVQSYIDGDGSIIPTDAADLDKEYIMFMVGSTFWGAEIASGTQTPLWTNPVLGATLNEVVRFHVLSLEHDHTFHLHAHRWLDEVDPVHQGFSPHIIDVKILTGKADSHAFTVKAGTGVGAGMWHLHCHVVSHMESNMAARFRVDEPGAASGVSVAGATPYGAILLSSNQSDPGLVTFEISDEPGSWFRSARSDAIVDPAGPLGALNIKTRSLEVMAPGSSAHFIMSDTRAVHTITTLIWPSDADSENKHDIPFDQTKAYRGGGIVQLNTPGLYVFTCKIHPYMFGAVIVDDPSTEGLDLGEAIDLVTGIHDLPTTSDLATRLLRTFFVATTQENWQDYTSPAPWHADYPDVNVRLSGGAVLNLQAVLESRYGQDIVLGPLSKPVTPGIGEVWINTQFEKTASKTKPGTITVLDTTNWTVKRKIALPGINMNHPHNMWVDRNQATVFQTQWFDNKLTFINQSNGQMIDNIQIGDSPSHVMTMPDSDDITVAINGENRIVTIPAGTTTPVSSIPTQLPGQVPANPHGHWITPEGKIVTPNINSSDTGFYDGHSGQIIARPAAGGNFSHGPHPIAIGVGNNRIYAANLLDHSLNVYDFDGNPVPVTANGGKPYINLIASYDPVSGDGAANSGILPIQTPVDPTGRVVVTANTGGSITIVDTSTNTVVAVLPCDPGCHGANFGAKAGGGYYAYITSKFSNRLIVVDPDPNDDGDFSDAAIAGTIAMADNSATTDDAVVSLAGMGGQGVLAIPNVYNGWVQQLPPEWQAGLTEAQRNPVP